MRHISLSLCTRFKMKGLTFILALAIMVPVTAWAGPPFITDDPEPVEYKHGELYLSSIYTDTKDGKTGTLPHVEANYGVIPDVQLHLLLPVAFAHSNGGPTYYGLGDTELGVKYRFVHESDNVPQIGIFPLVHVPTGDSDRGLGSGHVQGFLPLWLQKSWGPWTTYGGGGYWINPGTDKKNYWQLGWLVQRDICKALTLGAEVFHFGTQTTDGRTKSGYNIGGIINITDDHHILFSAGSDFSGDTRFAAYLGYQWTFVPKEEEKK